MPDPRPVYIVQPPDPPRRRVTLTGVAGTIMVLAVVGVIGAGLLPLVGVADPLASFRATAAPTATIDPAVAREKTAILARFDAASATADKQCRKSAGKDADKLGLCADSTGVRADERGAILDCFAVSETLAEVKVCEPAP